MAESTNPVNVIYDLDNNKPQFKIKEDFASPSTLKVNKFSNLMPQENNSPAKKSKMRYFSYTKNRIKKNKAKEKRKQLRSAQKTRKRATIVDKHAEKSIQFSKALKHHARK